MAKFVWAAILCAISAGCADKSRVPLGGAGFPPAALGGQVVPPAASEYLIGPLDSLSINVFNEPSLSVDEAPVSLSGKISMPLLGELPVSGEPSAQVAGTIEALLNARYLRNARVVVSVVKAANFTVTIDGEVKKPGVYQIPSAHLTLSQAVALGEGTTDVAKLDEVLVIRDVNGHRYAARFDLRAIRAAQMVDPQIQQSDLVVVGYSQAAALLRVLITALPGAAAIFVALRQ